MKIRFDRVQLKIVFLLLSWLVLSIIGLLLLRDSHNANLDQFSRQDEKEKRQLLNGVIDLKSSLLVSTVYDYTNRDEMVAFVNSQDSAWAYLNIEKVLPAFNINAVRIFDKDFKQIYSVNSPTNLSISAGILPEDMIKQMVQRSYFHHFFMSVNSELIEISFAPIQPTDDLDRKSPPQGYYLVGRIWDEKYIEEISNLTESRLTILPDTIKPGNIRSVDLTSGAIKIIRPMISWDGSAPFYLEADFHNPFLNYYKNSSNKELSYIICFLTALIVITLIAFYFWVGAPLRKISYGLDTEDKSALKNIADDKSAFGSISRMVGSFIDQKTRLENEIAERVKIENTLLTERRQLISIFESVNEPIYVSDPNTFEMLYVNETFRKIWGDGVGARCYSVLQNYDSPCPHCTNNKIFGANTGVPYIWEYQNHISERWFRCIDKAIQWPDGRFVRYEMALDITEFKQTEVALRKSEEMYRSVFESFMDLYYQTDINGILLKVSPSIEPLSGYRADEIIGKPAAMFYGDPKRRDEFIATLTRNGKVQDFELTLIAKDGHEVPASLNSHMVFDNSGKPLRIEGTLRDITERKRIEREKYDHMRRTFLQQKSIVDLSTNDSIVQGNIAEAAAVITGMSCRIIEVDQVGIWLKNDDNTKLVCIDLYNFQKNEHASGDIIEVRAYPRYFEALETGRALDASEASTDTRTSEFAETYLKDYGIYSLLDAPIRVGGKVVGVVCHEQSGRGRNWTSDEITFAGGIADIVAQALMNNERRRAGEMLLQSERRYRSFIESMHDGVGIADPDENITFANQAFCDLFGYPYDEITKMNFRQIASDDDWTRVRDETRKRLTGKYSRYEVTIRRKDGELRQVLISATPLCDNYGKVTGAIGVFTDITDRQKAEQEKQELREKLSRAQRMESLGVLAGGVAHDLNNILGPLVAYPELIRTMLPEESQVANYITRMESSAQRAVDVVQDLLTMARRGRYEMVPIPINEVIMSYLQSPDYQALASKHPQVKLVNELDTDLPKIHGSSAHLSKVIMNLVMNALEAMPHGGELKIKTECRYTERLINGYDNIEAGRFLIISISDTGLGIDRKDLKRIFEPFYSKKEMGRSGSGLGLAIVYGVVKDHNGYIDVYSEPNQGSQFIIYLPIVESKEQQTEKNITDIHGTEKILVVDDVMEQRELAATVLTSLGYKVDVAADGHAAIEYLKANSADIIILDMIMEDGFDGLDTYREIIKIRPDQKAIIASGFSETDRVLEAAKLGVAKYVRKPYSMQKLGKVIREVLIA